VSKAELTDLLEEHTEKLDIKDDSVRLDFRGFEIKTVRLTVQRGKRASGSGDWVHL
jgi:hypothetical protein